MENIGIGSNSPDIIVKSVMTFGLIYLVVCFIVLVLTIAIYIKLWKKLN